MNKSGWMGLLLSTGALMLLLGCGGKAPAAPKEGVVYVDPNAASAATAAPAAPAQQPAPVEVQPQQPAATAAPAAEETKELALYFEGKGVRLEPMMEAAPVLQALGAPIGTFEADSCAYLGKDLYYYYPGFELTVNEVDGVERITVITVVDDTIVTPQGLRIGDEEEKLLSLLGGREENGIYAYRAGETVLYVQIKADESETRRIASIEYRATENLEGGAV